MEKVVVLRSIFAQRADWTSVAVQMIARACALFAIVVVAVPVGPHPAIADGSRMATFEAVWQTARDKFFDPKMNGTDWPAIRAEFRPRVEVAKDDTEFGRVLDEMLARLTMSHTDYLAPGDPMLPILLDVYAGNAELDVLRRPFNNKPQLVGIGVFTREAKAKSFVDIVLDGSPAAIAGLRSGDEIVSVDGEPFHPDVSFAGKDGRTASIGIRRTSGGPVEMVTVAVRSAPALASIDDASRASVTVIERGGRKIGYARFFSLAGDAPQEILDSMPLTDVDALVLDVRGLVGGGGPSFLDQLDPRFGNICFATRSGDSCAPASFRGRTVLLTDDHTRSGAELLAYGFRRDNFGLIVGATTAGAVSGGRLFPLPNGGAVYVAVTGLTVEGKLLEGVGVSPDILVERPLPYAAGADPQFGAAIAAAECLARQEPDSRNVSACLSK